MISRYAGRIPDWDTFNEVGHGDFFKRHLGTDIWARAIARIRELDPATKIVFNEYQIQSGDAGQCFLEYLEFDNDRQNIDILGVQSHVNRPMADHVWENLEVVAGQNRQNRLFITEMDIQDRVRNRKGKKSVIPIAN